MKKEEFVLPNGEKVEFFSDTHTYLVRGIEVPSITEVLKRVHGDKYKNVNPELLERSAAYGTKVHKQIQDYIELRKVGIDIEPFLQESTQETKNYFTIIEPIYKIEPLLTEVVVVLYDEDNPIAAGRFDLVAYHLPNNNIILCDFKTTSSINTKDVSAQLNLYKRASEQSGYFQQGEITELAAIHLSGEQATLKPIPIFGETFLKKYIDAAKQKGEIEG